jgi:hypothetical protein
LTSVDALPATIAHNLPDFNVSIFLFFLGLWWADGMLDAFQRKVAR